ncbi:hypothetical protein [Nonomuraea dietziae]|uniref:hypothetical protein n=1 Tax=Nonomuraea dietziae TaxID=65515 RepID=UPI0033C0A2E7
MTIFTQDYPALPGSSSAAAQHAHTVVEERTPRRASDAYQLVSAMFTWALARSHTASSLTLITTVDHGRTRFELHFPNDQPGSVQLAAEQVSALADAYGERPSQRGRMIYAELWMSSQAVTT